jgi:hypothetical protein
VGCEAGRSKEIALEVRRMSRRKSSLRCQWAINRSASAKDERRGLDSARVIGLPGDFLVEPLQGNFRGVLSLMKYQRERDFGL